ncbi:hypothetical protein O4H52_19230 [Sphingomonadaceae bacterium G21617-S1]|nr:hypothetical protein [Sphingomonadaceae bacterium G21617-S1]
MKVKLGTYMAEDYFERLLELAASITTIADAEGSLDKREWKKAKEQQDAFKAEFKEIRDRFVDVLLSTPEGQGSAYEQVSSSIAEVYANCDPSWHRAVQYLSDELLPYLEKEAARNPRTRKLIKALPWALGAVAIIAYFMVRFLSATPIDHPLESKEGILERAAAVQKLLRYDDWMDTHVRKGGWLKGIMLWPIEPSENEVKGATEFAGIAYAANEFSVQRFGCSALARGYGDKPSKDELDYLSEMAEYLHQPNLAWKKPPIITLLDAAKAARKC